MSLPEPLFGPRPVTCSIGQVEAVCVHHYPESATRPHIWDGFQTARSKVVDSQTSGDLWLSGDFVVDHEDPSFAQVLFRIPAGVPKDAALLDLVGWLNDKTNSEQLSCDLGTLVEYPPDDPKAHFVREYTELLLEAFTAHGDTETKGFPIVPVP